MADLTNMLKAAAGSAGPNENSLYFWGNMQWGLLGNNTASAPVSPIPQGTSPGYTLVRGLGSNAFMIDSNNRLWGWGNNDWGSVGLSTVGSISVPTQIGALTDWTTELVVGGQNFSSFVVGVKTNGTLWSWGSNGLGWLGSNNTVARSSPAQVGALTNWSKVSAGESHVLAVKTDGTLWAWGSNGNGRSGVNSTAVSSYSSPVQIGGLNTWANAFAIGGQSYAVRTNGTLWAWGLGLGGVLGLNSVVSFSSPVQVGALTNWGAGSNSMSQGGYALQAPIFAVKTDGTLWAWGPNGAGTLGLNNTITRSSPVQVGALTDWNTITVTLSNVLARKTDGTTWVWGTTTPAMNLGNPATNNFSSPVLVGNTSWTQARIARNVWFFNNVSSGINYAALGFTSGDTGAVFDRVPTSPVLVGEENEWKVVYNGDANAYGIKYDDTLWRWGTFPTGSGGRNYDFDWSFSPIQLGTDSWKTIVSTQLRNLPTNVNASSTILGVKTNGTLWGWGSNLFGQLGANDTITRSSPVQIGALTNWDKLFVYPNKALAIKTNGTLWAWGVNSNGTLGINTSISSYSSPVQVGANSWRFASMESANAYAIRSDFTLWVWGSNNFFGALGLNNNDSINRSSPVQLGALANWATVAANGLSVLAVKTDGTLWAWGYNNLGELGTNDRITRSSPVQIGALTNWSKVHLSSIGALAVKTDGTLWGWGAGTTAVTRSSPTQIGSLTNWNSLVDVPFGDPVGALAK